MERMEREGAEEPLERWLDGLEPDYLAALDAVCERYEEALEEAFSRRPAPRADDGRRALVRRRLAKAHFARGARDAFADGGFDALFDFKRDHEERREDGQEQVRAEDLEG